MSSSNNHLSRRHGQKQRPPHANHQLSRDRRFEQHPASSDQETGAFAIPGVDGDSRSLTDDIEDDITLLEEQDSTTEGGGEGQPTSTTPATAGDSSNLNGAAEPVIAQASLVDEEAEAQRNRLLEQRMLALEEELQRIRATTGGEVPTASIERLVPPHSSLAHEEEEEKQEEVADPVPAAQQNQIIDGLHAPRQDLEAQPITVRLVADDGEGSASALPHDEADENSNEESDSSSHKRQRDYCTDDYSSSRSHRRRCRHALFATGFILVLFAVVVTAVLVARKSSGEVSTERPTVPPMTRPPTRFPTRRPTPTPEVTNPPTVPPLLDNISWKQLGADVIGAASGDEFGYSIALSADGKIMAVGAVKNDAGGYSAGHVRVFEYDGGRWNQLGAALYGAAGDRFGRWVALSSSGFILAVGGHLNDSNGDDSGHARVFEFNTVSNKWNQLGGDLVGEAAGDQFGWSVALSSDGTILAVGAHKKRGTNGDVSGHVRVLRYSKAEGRWLQLGASLNGEAAGDEFGVSVALSANGTILAVGGRYHDGNGKMSGHVRVFRFEAASSQEWHRLGADLDGKAVGDLFGQSVALSSSGSILAVGGPGNNDKGDDSGHIRVFAYSTASNKWNQLGGDLNGEAAGDRFGRMVALSGDGTILAAGRWFTEDDGSESGQVRIFLYNKTNETWNHLGENLNGKSAGDWFGISVALSTDGSVVAGGAIQRVFNGPGYAMVFQRNNSGNQV